MKIGKVDGTLIEKFRTQIEASIPTDDIERLNYMMALAQAAAGILITKSAINPLRTAEQQAADSLRGVLLLMQVMEAHVLEDLKKKTGVGTAERFAVLASHNVVDAPPR